MKNSAASANLGVSAVKNRAMRVTTVKCGGTNDREMVDMSTILQEIAHKLGIPEDVLVGESLASYLREKRRALMAERFEIFSRYNVRSSDEMRKRIESGALAEHPTWEDYIEVVNLEKDLDLLAEQLGTLEENPRFRFRGGTVANLGQG